MRLSDCVNIWVWLKVWRIKVFIHEHLDVFWYSDPSFTSNFNVCHFPAVSIVDARNPDFAECEQKSMDPPAYPQIYAVILLFVLWKR